MKVLSLLSLLLSMPMLKDLTTTTMMTGMREIVMMMMIQQRPMNSTLLARSTN